MEGELEPRWQADPARMRISDTERHQVAEILRQAAGEGRIDLTELDERLEATYAAKTYADLVPLTADLPVRDRKSTRLNSSHSQISYAVFCVKNKKDQGHAN